MPEEEKKQEAKKDLLKTTPDEAKEMDDLIKKGHQAHNTVGILTIIGIALLAIGGLYYRYDRMPGESRSFSKRLDTMVANQMEQDVNAFRKSKSIVAAYWPRELYQKLRRDIYMLCGLALLLLLVFVHMEKAKLKRSDLLVYRAMAREIEKLRLRLKQLEGGKETESDTKPDNS